MAAEPVLQVRELRVGFRTDSGPVAAVNDVSFDLAAGEVVGIVGESGSGKSQILMAIMGLIAQNGAAAGSIRLRGEEILGLKDRDLDRLRGAAMSMVFQDPMTSPNPYLRVSTQLTEVLVKHRGMRRREALDAAIEMLERVAIPEAARWIRRYPHEFSGGMRQRVMLSMALLCRPALLLADEPTTALDVTVQAQILDLLRGLRREFGTTILLVTHDLGVIASLCDRVIVLYGGRIMESGPVDALFESPKHPYTRGLLDSMPRLDEATQGMLATIPGQPPSLARETPGCPFLPRCPKGDAATCNARPVLQRTAERELACHKESL
jgi:oligopeptide transport system ATP-binding protein